MKTSILRTVRGALSRRRYYPKKSIRKSNQFFYRQWNDGSFPGAIVEVFLLDFPTRLSNVNLGEYGVYTLAARITLIIGIGLLYTLWPSLPCIVKRDLRSRSVWSNRFWNGKTILGDNYLMVWTITRKI